MILVGDELVNSLNTINKIGSLVYFFSLRTPKPNETLRIRSKYSSLTYCSTDAESWGITRKGLLQKQDK